jgi:FecR protein
MAYKSSIEGGYGSGASVFHVDASHADRIDIPDAELLFRGHFARSGPDLVLTGQDGHHHIVPGYFATEKHPDLVAPNGAHLSGDTVSLLAGSPTPGHYAQAGTVLPPEAIGKVEKVVGQATLVHNGVAGSLHVGDPVFKSDVVETGPNSSCGIAFPDGTALDLVAGTRMALNDYSFDANGSASNNALFTLVEGTFAFVAGQVAHTGNGMKIATPVATMGIRGTVGLFRSEPTVINANLGHVWSLFLHEDLDGSHHLGRIAIIDQNPTSATFGQVIYLLDSSDYIAYLEPQGSGLPPLVRLEPITASKIFDDRHFYDDLNQIVSAFGTNPQSGPGGSGDDPNFLFPEQPSQEQGGQPFLINYRSNSSEEDPTNLDNLSAPVQGGILSNSTPTGSPPPPFSTIFIWNGTGSWPTTPNWNLGTAPNSAIDQVIIQSGTVNYELGGNTSVAFLTVDPGATLDVTAGQLTIDGLIDNGTIVVEGDPPALVITGPTTVGSTIEAVDAGATVDFEDSTVKNQGIIAARQGGIVDFNDEGITNETGAKIEARDRRSLVDFTNATLDNLGIVAATHGGLVLFDGGLVFNEAAAADEPHAKIVASGCGSEIDFTNVDLINGSFIGALHYGSMKIENAAVTNESGATIEAVDHGSITFDAVNFTNDGTVLAADRGSMVVAAEFGAVTFRADIVTNDHYSTIAAIKGGLVDIAYSEVTNTHDSFIEATNGGTVMFDCASVTNTGDSTIEAKGPHSTIDVEHTLVMNDGGTIAAIGCDAKVELIDATIIGGTLESRYGGIIENAGGTSTLDGVTIADGTVIQANNDTVVDLKDTITVDGTITFEGCGTFTLDSPGAKIIGDAGTLDNLGTVVGAGTIGSCDGALSLINNGTIDANICGQTLNVDTGETITNLGILEAANGGRLLVDDPVTGGGTALVKGGTIDFAAEAAISQITFNNGAGTEYGQVIFNDANGLDVTVNDFAGTKPNLAHSDGIELTGTWTVESETISGCNVTLDLKNGCETAAFNFDDFDGNLQITNVNGNTLITDPAVSADSSNPSVSIGGPGNDSFVFQPGMGAQTAGNFNPQSDTIELDHFANMQNAQELMAAVATDAHGDAVIELGHNDSVTIPGMTASFLQAHLQSLVHLH